MLTRYGLAVRSSARMNTRISELAGGDDFVGMFRGCADSPLPSMSSNESSSSYNRECVSSELFSIDLNRRARTAIARSPRRTFKKATPARNVGNVCKNPTLAGSFDVLSLSSAELKPSLTQARAITRVTLAMLLIDGS